MKSIYPCYCLLLKKLNCDVVNIILHFLFGRTVRKLYDVQNNRLLLAACGQNILSEFEFAIFLSLELLEEKFFVAREILNED